MCSYSIRSVTNRLLVDDMIAVASAKPTEIVIHSLPRIGKGTLKGRVTHVSGYRERYWKKSRIVFATSPSPTLSLTRRRAVLRVV